MIGVQFDMQAGRFEMFLKSKVGTAHQRAATAMDAAMIWLQGQVKANYLSGQVLKNRTGTLRRSINKQVLVNTNDVTGSVGTNVVYARIHEYGYDGPETVKAHLRRTINGGTTLVREHIRHVHMPERSFLRAALRDNIDQIQKILANGMRLGT